MGDSKSSNPNSKFDQVRIITNPLSSNKNLDADGMIENILSKKQVFVKKSTTFPLWLTPSLVKVPPLYTEVWKAVQIPANPGYCNTPMLTQILMTSGVTTQTLGYIWSLANKKCIGVLTEEELYLTMALIAISQNGTVVHNLDILKQVYEPISPRLDLNIIKHFQSLQRFQQPHCIGQGYPGAGYNTPSVQLAQSNMSTESPATSTSHPSYASEHYRSEPYYNSPQSISSPYQRETTSKDNTAIQNISSMVQLQSTSQSAFGQSSLVDDDDEFSEFQSSVSIKHTTPTNVSITLNPIHYLMTSSSSKRPNGGNTPTVSSSSKSQAPMKKEMIAMISNTDEDDFSDFQSALNFDVQIKQPNILDNIKTIIDTKPQNQAQNRMPKTPEEHNASILVDNVSLKTKEDVLDTMSDERKTTMYSTPDLRDYSALKQLQSESLFELNESEPVDQTSAHRNKNTQMDSTGIEHSSNTCIFQEDTQDGKRNTDTTAPSKCVSQSTIVNSISQTFPVTSPVCSDFDDEFTDFKQAEPIKTDPDSTRPLGYGEPETAVPATSNYDYLRGLDTEHSLTKSFPSIFDREHKDNTANQDILFDAQTAEKNGLNILDVKENVDDDFDDFVQVLPQTQVLPQSPHLISQIPPLFKSFGQLEIKPSEKRILTSDEEFTDFEQAPVTFTIENGSSNIATPKVTITSQPKDDNTPEILLDNASTEGLDGAKTDPKDRYSALRALDFDEDLKYLSDGDTISLPEEKDKDILFLQEKDKDTLSLQEDRDKDVSDGDNVSLQLPSVDSPEHDNVQTKCYEACLYILDSSLNLFLTSQIENEIVEHPKVIHHLKCLFEVYQVGKRLQRCGQIITCSNKLDVTWNALTAFFSDSILAEIKLNQNEQDTGAERPHERCEICLGERDLIEEQNSTYHAPCINLYLNCVEPIPPHRTSVH